MMFHVLLHQQLQPVSGSPQRFTDVVPQLFLFLFLTALVCTRSQFPFLYVILFSLFNILLVLNSCFHSAI